MLKQPGEDSFSLKATANPSIVFSSDETKRSWWTRQSRYSRWLLAVLFIFLFAAAGVTTLLLTHAASAIPSGQVTLGGSKWCLDDNAGTQKNGNKVQLWTCSTNPNPGAQRWDFYSDDTIHLNANPAYCLDVKNAQKVSGTLVWLYGCNGTAAQVWNMKQTYSNGSVALMNPNSGLCLDNNRNVQAIGNKIQIWSCNDSAAQQWKLPSAMVAPPTSKPDKPTVSLTATPTVVPEGSAATLTWVSTNTASCAASGAWSGSKATTGSASTGTLSTNAAYTLTCTGATGSASATANIAITATTSGSLPDVLYNADPAPWNQLIGSHPTLDPNSSTMVNAVDTRVNPTMNAFGMPLYTSTASDPSYTVKCHLGTNKCDSLFDSKQPIHIPNNAIAASGDDHWLFVYDTTKNLIFEMWHAQKSGGNWTYETGNVYSPTSDGVHQTDGSVQDGNGSSYFAGVVSAADWKRGYINHALSLASQYTVADQGRYPMNSQTDGDKGNGHIVPMGARFFLDSSVNCDGLGASKLEAMVCHAMQKYGGYMHDTGGVALSIYFQENSSAGSVWSNQGWNENMTFSKIPWNKMHVLKSWNSYTAATNP